MIVGYPTLGFDPAPGDPDDVAVLGRTIAGASQSMAEVDALLVAADQREWLGDAAVAFRNLLAHEFGPRVSAAAEAFGIAERVIWTWSDDLREFQREARDLEGQARSAQDEVDRLTQLAAAEPGDEDAQTRVDDAQQHRDDIQGLAWALKERYETRGGHLAGMLGQASSLAPAAPTLLVAIGQAFQGALEQMGIDLLNVGDMVFAGIMMLSPTLSFVSDVLGVLALVPVPVLSAVLGTVGLVASLGPLLTEHGGDWAAVVSDGRFLEDLAGVLAGVVGLRFAARAVTRVDDIGELIVRAAHDPSVVFDILTLPFQEAYDAVDRWTSGGPWIQPPEVVP